MAKYRELPDDVNPSLKVDVRPFDNSSGDDPAAFLKQMETPLSEGFEDFQMVVSPKETTIAGCKAAYMKIYYSYPIAGGPRVPTCSEIWAIPRKHLSCISRHLFRSSSLSSFLFNISARYKNRLEAGQWHGNALI